MPEDLTFASGDGRCAAWRFDPPGLTGPAADVLRPVVVMAHGFSLTRHDGLAAHAERLAERAGVTVLAFDHRHLGDSTGEPRQRFRPRTNLEDWRSAVATARTLAGVDPTRVVLWCFSFSAVAAVQVAAEDRRIAGLLALCPFLDGRDRALRTPPALLPWIVPRAIADALGRHTTIPVTAQPGGRGAMTLPGEADGFARVVPPGSPWRNRISPGVFLTVSTVRPVRRAAQVRAPVWLGLAERDVSVSNAAIERFAAKAPRAELQRYPHFDHFDPFTGDGPDVITRDAAAFLRRHDLAGAAT